MTIRKRTLLIICVTMLGLIVTLYLAAQFIVLEGFARQEMQEARRDVERVVGSLDDDLATLEGTTRDWAIWDDTYTYIAGENPDYYTSNLVNTAPMAANRLSFAFFVATDGRIVWGRGYDATLDTHTPYPDSFRTHLSPGGLLLQARTDTESIKGIVSLPEGPVLVSSVPILKSNGEGPSNGWVIFARYLDTQEIARLSKTTLYSLSTYRTADPNLPPDFRSALARLGDGGKVVIEPVSSNALAGYALSHDIYGQPALLLRADIPRWLHAQGEATLLYLLAALLAVAAVAGIVVLVLLERGVLSRMNVLRQRVSAVAASRDVDLRVQMTGSDELSSLAGDINGMLDALQRSQDERHASESKYRVLMEQASDGIAVYDFDGRILEANSRACEMLGYTANEMLRLNLAQIVDRGELDIRPIRFDALKAGQILVGERTLCRKDGSTFPSEISSKLLRDGRGIQAIVRDITERKETEDALRREKDFSESLINSSAAGIMAFDCECRYTIWNPGMERITGVSKERVLGHIAFDLFPFLAQTGMDETYRATLAGKTVSVTNREFYIPQTDKRGYFESRYSPLYDQVGEVVGGLAIVNDVTERKALEEQVEHQAFHDSLTGLPNRALFMDRLGHALTRSAQREGAVAVLFLDLDDFKVINDSLGHKAGDLLLREVGKRLQTCLRPIDTVARLGGDEFTLLLEDLDSVDDAMKVAERVAEQLMTPFSLDGHEVFVSTSIGIALSREGGAEPDDLLRDADVAMYEAKNGGKSRHAVFNLGMNARAWKRLEMEIELRRAIERNEFTVYYQPVVRLDTGHPVEVEALVRWQHPTRNLVAPGDFIPVAEETGLIIQIGEMVLREACGQVRKWQLEGLGGRKTPLLLSVNLSARQFKQPDLVERVAFILHETGFDPACLKLEITESVALDDTETTLEILRRLRSTGISLAIDDFGTGYSALSYLKRYPISTLKIDRSFIDGLGHDLENQAIVRAVIAFAQTLNLTVTAEGIETWDQLCHLRELHCEHGQGYYFSRPVPAYEMEELLQCKVLPAERATVRLNSGMLSSAILE